MVGYEYAYKYANNLKNKILRNLEKHGKKVEDLNEIINFILDRKTLMTKLLDKIDYPSDLENLIKIIKASFR